ncbi:MAG: hypothetical protein ACJ8AT_11925 [Hyalangium sp.]|uniref:hypothetical protein n=1 Tax=Hyalangium sp. TaxID=2028555 RepID=UPI00389A5741
MVSFCSRWGVVSLLLLGTGCGVGFNKSPVVTEGPAVSEEEIASGTEVRMHLVVTDEDGDPLSYKWVQEPADPAGSFSDINVKEPSWVAPPVSSDQYFVLKVIIMDPEHATLLGMTSVLVRPK